MSALTRESVQHHCRTCLINLETKVDEIGLPRQWFQVDTTENLSDWILNFTSLPALATSTDYPKFVCQECYEKFRDFRDFQDQVCKVANTLEEVFSDVCSNNPLDELNIMNTKQSKPVTTQVKSDFKELIGDNAEWSAVREEHVMVVQDKLEDFDPELFTPSIEIPDSNDSTDIQGLPKASKAYKCEQCNRYYAHKYTYIAHMRQDHQGVRRAFECEYCHKSYTKFCNLYRHMRLEHDMSLRQFKCEFPNCNRSFRYLTTRRKHYQQFHLGRLKRPPTPPSPPDSTLLLPELLAPELPAPVKRFKCSLCSENFETLYNLKIHMVCHRDDMKFVCTICGKRKISQLKLDEHYATVHHPKNAYPCNICQKVFKCKSHVSVHIMSVHKGLRPYACHYCPSQFAAKNTLKIHERLHTGEKPFACEICGRRFTQLTPMKKHRQTHDKERRPLQRNIQPNVSSANLPAFAART